MLYIASLTKNVHHLWLSTVGNKLWSLPSRKSQVLFAFAFGKALFYFNPLSPLSSPWLPRQGRRSHWGRWGRRRIRERASWRLWGATWPRSDSSWRERRGGGRRWRGGGRCWTLVWKVSMEHCKSLIQKPQIIGYNVSWYYLYSIHNWLLLQSLLSRLKHFRTSAEHC